MHSVYNSRTESTTHRIFRRVVKILSIYFRGRIYSVKNILPIYFTLWYLYSRKIYRYSVIISMCKPKRILEKCFNYKDIWQIFFSVLLSNTEKSRLWCCLAVLVIVQDGTGEKKGTFLKKQNHFTFSDGKTCENNASQVKLLQIFYILYGYMINRNLASLSSILSSKSIRDFFF